MKTTLIFRNILDVDEKLKQEVRVWRNQDFVRSNMYNKHEITEEEHRRFLNQLENCNDKLFFICFLNDKPIGIVSYSFYNKDKNVEFAYYLKDKENLSKGYGAVFEYKFLNYFFFNLKIKTVTCEVLVKNKRTISLHEKFGFVKEKIFIDTEKADEEIYKLSLNIEQWNKSMNRIERVVNRIINIDDIREIY